VLGVGVMSLLALSGFVAWELASDHPMLELELFRDRRFSIAALGETFALFGLLGALFVQTQYLQFDLGYSPLQAGVRILPIAAVLGVTAALSPLLARVIGTRLTMVAGLASIAGGLCQISAASSVASTYGAIVPGMMLIGLGAGLLIPTATNSVIGAVSQGDSGVGSATNGVALQVGGALGVAVIGSVLSSRYQDSMKASMHAVRVPSAAAHTILSSFGAALGLAADIGGATGAELTRAARIAFISGARTSLIVGSLVALGGGLLVFACFPSRRRARRILREAQRQSSL
jgi:hypothetical protein